MSGDGIQTQALVQKPDPSAIGVGLLIAFVPIHLLVVEEISVAIAALTLALIGGALFYTVGALAGLLCNPLGLRHMSSEFSTPQRGILRAGSEMVYCFLRRFWSARRCIYTRSLSPVRCDQ